MNLIEEFTFITQKYCDTPQLFSKAGGYFLVSSLLGKYFSSSMMPPPGRPNIWFILSSIPGRMRRSSIHGYTMYVYEKVMIKYLKDNGCGDEDIDKQVLSVHPMVKVWEEIMPYLLDMNRSYKSVYSSKDRTDSSFYNNV